MTAILLHNIKEGPTSNYDSRERLEAYLKEHPNAHLTFDGVYESVYENRDLLTGRRVTLFITGAYIGGDNSFDEGQPVERFCSWEQIRELEGMGCELGWHTITHPDLTTLGVWALPAEIYPPFPMDSFAYPYGKFNEGVVDVVKAAGYKYAYSTNRGDGSRFALKRQHLPK